MKNKVSFKEFNGSLDSLKSKLFISGAMKGKSVDTSLDKVLDNKVSRAFNLESEILIEDK